MQHALAQANADVSSVRYLVCEAFSPPRSTESARKGGKKDGWAPDVAWTDPITGRKWDLSDDRAFGESKRLLRRDRPTLLVVSPPCTLFSRIRRINGVPDPKQLECAKLLIRRAIELCMIQESMGGVWMFEHPEKSSAWHMPELINLLLRGTTHSEVFHQNLYK